MAHALSIAFPSAPFKILSELKSPAPLWKLSKVWPEDSVYTNQEVGDIGEDLAVEYVKTLRYKVLYRNFNPEKGGEIDLVCRDQDTLVFIEVKTRVSALYRPLSAVNKAKRKYLTKGANQYLQMLNRKPDYRFDVVEVYLEPDLLPRCNLVKGIEV